MTQNNFTDTLKTKLDGIATSANNYSLPNASASSLGGIKVGTNLSIDVNESFQQPIPIRLTQ